MKVYISMSRPTMFFKDLGSSDDLMCKFIRLKNMQKFKLQKSKFADISFRITEIKGYLKR